MSPPPWRRAEGDRHVPPVVAKHEVARSNRRNRRDHADSASAVSRLAPDEVLRFVIDCVRRPYLERPRKFSSFRR